MVIIYSCYICIGIHICKIISKIRGNVLLCKKECDGVIFEKSWYCFCEFGSTEKCTIFTTFRL